MQNWAHFEQLDAALETALELDPTAREDYLDKFSSKHPTLGTNLRHLLDAATGKGPLDVTSSVLPDGEETEAEDQWLGARLGPYEVIECVGQGGMGRVYRAHRVDGAYEGDVAIKRLRDASGLAASRFEAERHILASLDHANVARLLDAGTHEGAPYLVMEFVVGQSLVDYAQAEQLDRKARLRLLATVGDAVAYAHDRLVVHRDLKPSNILVRDDGRPVLLDFGIAKLLDPHGDETRTEHRMFSPRWAAPEQVRGDFAGPRADVYSLGLLVRTLLVPDHEQRSARGDLRFVLERALAAEPERRYTSARDLAADLRALHGGQVVAARPGRFYRVRRFVVRHAALVFAAALSLSLLLVYTASVVQQRAELELERDRVRAQARRATASAQFLEEMFTRGVQGRAVGESVDVRSVLERATAHLSDEPKNLDLLLLTARAYAALGDTKAIALAQRARALADRHDDARVLQALRIEARANTQAKNDVASAEVAKLLLARALDQGSVLDPSVGLALVTLADAISQREPFAAVWLYLAGGAIIGLREGPWHEEFASALVGAGFSAREMLDLGAWAIEQGLRIQVQHYGPVDLRVADTLQKLAHQQSKLEDKSASLHRAVEIERAILGPDHIWVSNSLNDIGLMLQASDPQASIGYLREAARIEQVAQGVGVQRRRVARTNLGAVLRQQGYLDEARQVLAPLLEEADDEARDRSAIGYFLALVRRDQGEPQHAIALLERALDDARRHHNERGTKRVMKVLDELRPSP